LGLSPRKAPNRLLRGATGRSVSDVRGSDLSPLPARRTDIHWI
jgi:hypothetical protein